MSTGGSEQYSSTVTKEYAPRDQERRLVSPEAAVRRAVWMVQVPSMAVLLGPLGAVVLLMELSVLPSEGTAAVMWTVASFLSGFVGGWLVWSLQVPRWRAWAYRAVQDIEALKRLAVQRQIIWPEGHIFEKTELASKALKEELERLEIASRNR